MQLSRAIMTLSIDVDPVGKTPSHERRDLGGTLDWLLELTDRLQIAATWTTAEPITARWPRHIASREAGHELAIVGEREWITAGGARLAVARALAEHTATARSLGIEATTIVSADASFDEYRDVMAKYGLTAISPRPARFDAAARPGRLRYGLWCMPPAIALPGTSRMVPGGGGGRTIERAIDRAIAERTIVHVLCQVERLAERGKSARRTLSHVLQHAATLREQERLEILTIAGAVRQMAGSSVGQPTQSILRAA